MKDATYLWKLSKEKKESYRARAKAANMSFPDWIESMCDRPDPVECVPEILRSKIPLAVPVDSSVVRPDRLPEVERAIDYVCGGGGRIIGGPPDRVQVTTETFPERPRTSVSRQAHALNCPCDVCRK